MSDPCRLCNSTDSRPVYSVKGYTIRKCMHCGFVFTTPLDQKESIYALYRHQYFNSGREQGYPDYEQHQRIRRVTFSYYYSLLNNYLSGRKENCLDVGCSDGSFLQLARQQGFTHCEGIELNEEMFNATSKLFKVYQQPLELFTVDKQYDLVTLFDVLEHIPDLKAACSKLSSLTRKDGLLVILTPDYGSRERKWRGKNWFQFKPKEHINYFTLPGLRELLNAHGFETVYSEAGVSVVDPAFISDRLKRYNYRMFSFLFSLFGSLLFIGRKHIKIRNSSIFLIAKRV